MSGRAFSGSTRVRTVGLHRRGLRTLRKAKKLNRVQRAQVRGIISKKIEPKFFDTVQGFTQIDRGATITSLTLVPQGNAQSKRVGDELYAKHIELRLSSYFNSNAVIGNPQHSLRIIVFRWNIDTSIATPALGSILAPLSASVNDFCAPYDWNAKRQGDFTILMDKMYNLAEGALCPALNLRIPVKRRITYDPAATTGEGHIYILQIGDDVTGAHTPSISVQWYARLLYTDQ